MSYERETIRRMAGYVPGEQPADDEVVKLNTNENPYPPAPAVLDALRGIQAEALRRYPSPSAAALRRAAAEHHGIGADNVIATNGGDELLRLAVTTFVDPGAPVGIATPSYSLYPVLAAVQDSRMVAVPLDADWRPPPAFAERMNRAGVTLTFLVNPHAPSGTLLDSDTISAIASILDGVLLVDEAYVDFVDPEREHDLIRLSAIHDNLLILRTLSKGYSLAGLRVGYGIGNADLVRPMAEKTRDSYSVDAIAERLAATALGHAEAASTTWCAVRSERQRLRQELSALGLPAPPSQSNFLLAHVPTDLGPAASLYRHLRDRGILVRYFDQPRLSASLRISVGTPQQNDRLLTAIRAFPAPPWAARTS